MQCLAWLMSLGSEGLCGVARSPRLKDAVYARICFRVVRLGGWGRDQLDGEVAGRVDYPACLQLAAGHVLEEGLPAGHQEFWMLPAHAQTLTLGRAPARGGLKIWSTGCSDQVWSMSEMTIHHLSVHRDWRPVGG